MRRKYYLKLESLYELVQSDTDTDVEQKYEGKCGRARARARPHIDLPG